MPVPSTIADLSSTASSNYPSGSESIGTSLDDYIRSHAAIIKQVSDAKADTSHTQASSTVTYTQSGTGAVTSDVQTKLREFVSVKDFGAVGDGIANDTTAIQNAIAKIVALGGGTVYFPAGDYKITSPITINTSYVFLQGEGGSLDGNTAFVDTWANIISKAATRIFWAGTAANTMLTIQPTDVAGSPALLGGGFDGIMWDCAELAQYGVTIKSVRNARYSRSSIVRHTVLGLTLGVNTNDLYNGGSGTNTSLSLCEFDDICVSTAGLTDRGEKSVLMFGNGLKGGVNQCIFKNNQWYRANFNADNVDIENSDDNVFFSCRWTGRVVMHSSDSGTNPVTSDYPGSLSQNHFWYFPLGNFTVKAGVEAIGTGWTTATVVGAGATRWYGFNKYTTVAGGTTGATPPTHVSGSVSDGGVTWNYVKSVTPSFGHGCWGHSANLVDGLTIKQKISVESGADFSIFGTCIDFSNRKGFMSYGAQPATTTVYRNTNQTITSSPVTTVTWESSDDDRLDAWLSGSPTDVTVPTNIKFASITFSGKWENNSTGQRYAAIYIDGVPYTEHQVQSSGLSPFTIHTGPIPVTPGQVITARVLQASGADRTLIGGSTRMIVEWR